MKKKLTITRVNPVAKALLMLRKPIQTVNPKKGKGSYDRTKEIRQGMAMPTDRNARTKGDLDNVLCKN